MNRRKFLKFLGLAAAAPVVAKVASAAPADKPVFLAFDPAKPGSDTAVWGIETEGGYIYSDELSEKLRDELTTPLRTLCQYNGSIRIESKEDLRKRSAKAANTPDHILERWYRIARRETEKAISLSRPSS